MLHQHRIYVKIGKIYVIDNYDLRADKLQETILQKNRKMGTPKISVRRVPYFANPKSWPFVLWGSHLIGAGWGLQEDKLQSADQDICEEGERKH